MSDVTRGKPVENSIRLGGNRDIGFAIGIVAILIVLFLPIPPFLLDMGLALSITLSVVILMVALWIPRPLDFSAFPTVLLIATMLRLSLNVATTRLILAHGHEGPNAAGHMVGGFSKLVMSGDFVIGLIVFLILITINFIVITKGATRIAEVGARFTLDAIPGKQMAIDADLSAGLIDEKEARRRRAELEQESSFFGSMDGASKFVRGDAIAGIIITGVNIVGGIIIGMFRHGMSFSESADTYVQLSVGDGLVTQIPALIVSLAAGLLVSKGGNRGAAQETIFLQLGAFPRALLVAGGLLAILALVPGLPFFPFAVLSVMLIGGAAAINRQTARVRHAAEEKIREEEATRQEDERNSVKELLRTAEIELRLGRQISAAMLVAHGELAHRVAKMRRRFAQEFGFVIPDIRLSDDLLIPARSYGIRIHGTTAAAFELRVGELLVIPGGKPKPALPGDEVREPAFGMEAYWYPDVFAAELRAAGHIPVDPMSVMLTHLSEVIRNNLGNLMSYKDLRGLTDRLDPEYKRLLDETCPSLLSFSGFQAILKLLLSERVSIRNLHLILEAVAEVAPYLRKPELIVEHVRLRLAQQICGDLAQEGTLRIVRLGNRWDVTFLQSLKRDAKGDVVEFDIDPRLIEQFASELTSAVKSLLERGDQFALVTAPEARPYVRLIVDRLFPTLPVLSHIEISKGIKLDVMASLS
ncbi:flagellar biosynthesis protein FlhA [Aestuariivirga sp.]|jgi:flagellar biosynthesis protein FlhA|uniref:flagellar biosynthesis protein FlhA n=1 Tax=Aestuariivirga sp. TaxID=2650926 RepID=UPI003784D047